MTDCYMLFLEETFSKVSSFVLS